MLAQVGVGWQADGVSKSLREQVIAIDRKIAAVEAQIAAAEGEMNDVVYGLYRLTAAQRRLVEVG